MTPLHTRSPLLSDRQGFDRRWFAANLRAVYVPRTPEEVVASVTAAVGAHGRQVKVSSGRHCYESFVYAADTAAIIDMSGLAAAGFDEHRQTYFIDAGCENWTAYRTLLNGHGKTLPAGSCYSVGAGGHITGGGYGLLSRLHGLTVDHLSAVDIVTWDAERGEATLRHVSDASPDPDERALFWALRGAGNGNFGVIVRYHFARLPVAPEHASLWTLAWDWAGLDLPRFAALLDAYGALMADLPDDEFTLLKLNHVAQGQIGLIWQRASQPGATRDEHQRSTEARADELRRRLDALAPRASVRRPFGGHPGLQSTLPSSHAVQHLTYLEAVQTLNGSGPNQYGKYKSAYMNRPFPADQIAAIHRWLHTTPTRPDGGAWDMSQCLLQVDSYGGAINRHAPDATAVPQRSSIMKLQYQAYWNNDAPPGEADAPPYQEQSAAYLGWIDRFYAEVYAEYGGTPDPARDASGTVAGCYYNYPDVSLGTHADGRIDAAMQLYFLDNFRENPRNLVAIKRRWDPLDVFHHAQSIPLA